MFQGSQCFPTLIIYIACCPPLDVVPEEDLLLQCPQEYLEHRDEDCCGSAKDRADFIFRVISAVAESKMSAEPAERSYVVASLERILMDYDHHYERAWRMLALTTAADACVQADYLKDAFTSAIDTMQPLAQIVAELLPRAMTISRRLAKAALRLEAFASFLHGSLAVNSGRSFPEVQHEEVQSNLFGEVLMTYYKLVVTEHDELAYNMIPRLQESTVEKTVPINTTAEVNLLFLNLGQSAKLGFTTLWSILRRRSQPLRIFVLGDAEGLEDWRANLRSLDKAGKLKEVNLVTFEYLDFTQHPKFKMFMSEYPSDCDVNEIGEALLARFICHELLPDVDRVIAMDLADILVLDDIKDLWEQFDTFEEHHVFAAAHITALHHVNGGLALYDLSRTWMLCESHFICNVTCEGSQFGEFGKCVWRVPC
ncbi:unnamed protein product [Durusdinium trenchii]|uniref:Hexosyltransferase n=1 Tax=Durusdinium trenchii TaxID=1381693 RepID=A0ABP0LCQ9_9DINO